jgi:hypothetical protein
MYEPNNTNHVKYYKPAIIRFADNTEWTFDNIKAALAAATA